LPEVIFIAGPVLSEGSTSFGGGGCLKSDALFCERYKYFLFGDLSQTLQALPFYMLLHIVL